jgi:glycerophosphoryl diester phosphodiesterase
VADRLGYARVSVITFERESGPLLFGHRGAPFEQPENTLESFAAALDAGADVLELDVHMTLDRQVVVAHDDHGRRMAKMGRSIRDTPLSEIKSWDVAGGKNRASGLGPVRMPTLEEVLLRFPHTPLNVDVKPRSPDMLDPLLELIIRHGAASRVLLTSFHSATTRGIARRGYPGPRGLSRAEVARVVFSPSPLRHVWPAAGQRMQIPLRAGRVPLARAELVHKAHDWGLAVDFWVVNDSALAERLLELGADGIVTDEPRAMAGLFQRSPKTGRWRERQLARDAPAPR